MRRRRPALLALLLSIAAVAAGCGGADDDRAQERSPVTTAASDADLAVPEPLRIGWKTDFTRATVPYGEIQSGGPGKDDIPPVDRPRFEAPAEVDWLGNREPVIELVLGDAARAYPLQIMTWHEIVNDVVTAGRSRSPSARSATRRSCSTAGSTGACSTSARPGTCATPTS